MIPVLHSIARIPILRGLYRIALNGYARLSRGRYTVEERMGFRLLLDLDNVSTSRSSSPVLGRKGPSTLCSRAIITDHFFVSQPRR